MSLTAHVGFVESSSFTVTTPHLSLGLIWFENTYTLTLTII